MTRAIGVFALASLFLTLQGATAQQPPVKTVATILQLHEAMLTPASDALFAAGAKPPTTAKQWKTLRNDAIILAESGNLLMLGKRAKDHGQWMKMSLALVNAGAAALKAVDTKNPKALMQAGNQINAACVACHVPYRDHGPMLGASRR